MMFMWLLGQIPGVDEAVQAARPEGWVSILFVAIVVSSFATLGYLIRQTMKEAREREKEASARISHLEDFIRTKMMDSLQTNSVVMEKMLAAAQSMCDAANEMSSAIAHCRLQGGGPREIG